MRKISTGDDGRVSFWCPGCNRAHTITVFGPDGWGWNGSIEKPTFTPSVLATHTVWDPPVTSENLEEYKRSPWEQVQIEAVCHSFVTAGQIQFLADSTHSLAGQTVELPDWPRDR
jgi:hypothetical protein